jgi:hypothetical protein
MVCDSYFSLLFILRGKFSYWVLSYCNRHILRLGGFHSLSCFLSSIGKLWADGGLRDLLVDSGVYTGNTAELMLVGKEFNRDVRGFTLVFDALQVLFIAAFIHWCRTSCNNVAPVTNLCLLASKRAFKVVLLELVYDLWLHRSNKGNNKIAELRTILQRKSQNSYVYKQTKSVNNRKTVKTVMTLTWYRHF